MVNRIITDRKAHQRWSPSLTGGNQQLVAEGGGGGKGEERQDVSQEVKGMYEERKVNVVVRE